jgi:membrane protein CcdC involved in cytochrome C biogenesis
MLPHHINYTLLSLVAMLFIAVMAFVMRMRETKRPVTGKNLLLPPLFMSTGFAMFLFPGVGTPLTYDVLAFLAGVILSVPLILTSRFEESNGHIYMKPSKYFIVFLLSLIVVRLIVKLWIGDTLSPFQTAGLFFIFAFGMILPWRLAMWYLFQQMTKKVTQ